jgi:hypothetical protein
MTQADNKKIFYILSFTIIDGHLHELRVSYQMQKLLTLHEHLSSRVRTQVLAKGKNSCAREG